MNKTDVADVHEYNQNAAQRREMLCGLLECLETPQLQPDERERVCMKAHALIDTFRREREQLVRCVAEESIFLDEAATRLKEIERVYPRKQRKHMISPAPTNAQVDMQERKMRHFAQGMSFYKLFWVFFVGCFGGVIIERLWALIRYGVFEPRVGLLYGPFNLVYGIGACALTAALYPARKRNPALSFLGGMLIGSVVEYGCSLFQEAVFGSVSWDYSNRPFNLNGRICLLYSIYWGALGVIWIKELYPRIARGIMRIPNRIGKPLTWMIAVFMGMNALMTGTAVLRWAERQTENAPSNGMEVYFDAHYPDERMQKIFSNLEFIQDGIGQK